MGAIIRVLSSNYVPIIPDRMRNIERRLKRDGETNGQRELLLSFLCLSV
jgi:hypothetical protein